MKLSNSFKKIIRSSWFKPVLKQSTISILAIIGLVISSVAFAKTVNISGTLDMNGNGIINIGAERAIEFDGGEALITNHDGYGNFNILSGIDHNNDIVGSDGGARVEMSHSGTVDIEIYSGSVGNSGSEAASYAFGSSALDVGGSDVGTAATVDANTFSGGSCDLAEYYELENKNSKAEAGDIMVFTSKGNTIKISNEKYDRSLAGVVSTDPAILLGKTDKVEGEKEEYRAIALSGKVPVKVTAENGPIEPGDSIVPSPRAGYGMKCNDYTKCAGSVVGKALEGIKKGEKRIKILIN